MNCSDILTAPFKGCILTTKRYYRQRKRELATIPITFVYNDYRHKELFHSPLDKFKYPKTFLNTIKL